MKVTQVIVRDKENRIRMATRHNSSTNTLYRQNRSHDIEMTAADFNNQVPIIKRNLDYSLYDITVEEIEEKALWPK